MERLLPRALERDNEPALALQLGAVPLKRILANSTNAADGAIGERWWGRTGTTLYDSVGVLGVFLTPARVLCAPEKVGRLQALRELADVPGCNKRALAVVRALRMSWSAAKHYSLGS